MNREIISEILIDMGYTVFVKPDVTSALNIVQKNIPTDLVVTDYHLPDSDGFALVDAVRKVLPDVSVIMMTAYGDVESYIKSMSLDVFEYLNKPLKKDEFERIVQMALRVS